MNFGRIRKVPATAELVVETHELKKSLPWLRAPILDFYGAEIRSDTPKEVEIENGVVSRQYIFVVTLKKLPDPGQFRGYLVFTEDNATSLKEPIAEVPLLGIVPAAITASPSHLYSRLDEAGLFSNLSLLVVNEEAKTFTIAPEAEALMDFIFDIELQDNAYLIKIKARHSFKETKKTKLKFRTNVPDMETVEVPLMLTK